jgi:hypothetical protein
MGEESGQGWNQYDSSARFVSLSFSNLRTALAVVSTQADYEEKNAEYASHGMNQVAIVETTAEAIYVELQEDEVAHSIGLDGNNAVDAIQKVYFITS